MKKSLKIVWRLILILVGMGLTALILPRILTTIYAMNRIHQKENTPRKGIAIVFGAGLRRDGTPTAILRDRVETAASLYLSGRVEELLMSGDGQLEGYNEPEAMRRLAISLGVPDEAISLDYAGRRTYDTCYRARAVFGVKNALLVTQKFHLPRALFLCNALGVDALGVEANNRRFWRGSLLVWNVREQLATLGAFWDLFVDHPQPVVSELESSAVD
ncbi:MAG TPA: ElyC/SanA/YdcF family protein [Anaerolineales bacterium]|nr:ElyC/SanA/YdcF family protein [Anaerolineales bacterium]